MPGPGMPRGGRPETRWTDRLPGAVRPHPPPAGALRGPAQQLTPPQGPPPAGPASQSAGPLGKCVREGGGAGSARITRREPGSTRAWTPPPSTLSIPAAASRTVDGRLEPLEWQSPAHVPPRPASWPSVWSGPPRGWGHRPESPRPSLGQENRGVGGGGRVFLAAGARACTKG